MWVHFLICSLFFAFVLSFSYANDKKIEVAGIAECADCKESNIKSSQTSSGLHVTIECKLKNGEVKSRGEGKVEEGGKFEVLLPERILQEGKLKEECYAQLYTASAACPVHSGLEESKIVVFKSKTDGKYRLKPKGVLKFSYLLCKSDFYWPFCHPRFPPWEKKFPPLNHFGYPWFLPPFPPIFHKPCPPIYMSMPPLRSQPNPPAPSQPPTRSPINPTPPPIYQPLPPPIPIYKPKPPVKLLPPPIPICKPPIKPVLPPLPISKSPLKPLPPQVPIYKPPVKKLLSPVPIHKPPVKPVPPPVPVYKPLVPIYNPPVYQPLPPPVPIYKPFPPILWKPCFPFPWIPPHYFHHPKIGWFPFPPLPPLIPPP
ncbi:Hypothetical predicted protein [Olea europaea subsp. europaea]|uniref:Proline-rich protein n=1 Tax=Olea europaea subsp. europaea TaxID=158383 RepID=A0A8S0VAL6_OLEEU|nr:Hypothetical predicted protein [Olea europaea subsp. europaea]